MSWVVNLNSPTLNDIINAMLALPPTVRKYRVVTRVSASTLVKDHCILLVDDASETLEVITCTPLQAKS